MDSEKERIFDDALSMKLFGVNVNPHPSSAWFKMATEEEIAEWQSADKYLTQVFLERKAVQRACDRYTKEIAEEEEGIRHEVKFEYDLDQIKQVPIEKFTLQPVKRAGKNKVISCMWHQDKHPSCVLFNNRYHCFSCNADGSNIDYCMEEFGFTFNQAVEFLYGYI